MLSPTPKMQKPFLETQTTFWNVFLMNEKLCISIQISLKFVPKCPVDNKSALAQVMAWCRTGVTSHYRIQCPPRSLTRICGTIGVGWGGLYIKQRKRKQKRGHIKDFFVTGGFGNLFKVQEISVSDLNSTTRRSTGLLYLLSEHTMCVHIIPILSAVYPVVLLSNTDIIYIYIYTYSLYQIAILVLPQCLYNSFEVTEVTVIWSLTIMSINFLLLWHKDEELNEHHQ